MVKLLILGKVVSFMIAKNDGEIYKRNFFNSKQLDLFS